MCSVHSCHSALSLLCSSETEDKDLDRTPTPPPPPSPKRTNPVPQTTTAPPRVTTPAQPVPKSPQEVPEPQAQNAPARVASPRDTYDNVNLLMSVLPPELRTEENLEGRPLGLAEVRQLEEEERRKEQSYEDVEVSLRRKEAAVEGVRWLAASSPEREGSDDLYTNPADAIADEEAVKAAAKKGSLKKKKRKRESRKSESESVSSAEQHVPELYTTVFDHLPVGEREVVQTKRGVSGSPSPHTERRTLGEGGGGGGVKRDVCGYEDVEDDMIARSAPSKDSPFSGGVAKLDDTYVAKKSELKKRYSHPASSRRDREGAKELVEVNPRSKKPVTLSSGRRKKIQKEEVDGEEGEGPKSADSSPTAKEFGITDKGGPQDSYAMVDMAGKFRYRAESDSMKREGSGAPKHYTVKEKPPESDSKQVELVVVET